MSERSATMTGPCKVHFGRGEKGRVEMRAGPEPVPASPIATGRVPRIARLMALAIRFDELLRRGEVKDYAELARVGHVTLARVTQIMNLMNLAHDNQETILYLPLVNRGRDSLKELQVRPLTAEPLWTKQRRRWSKLHCE